MTETRVIISCEHASNRIPRRFHGLGLPPDLLASHIAWDPGAREIARTCARRLRCAYHEGVYSRLLVDLNRHASNPAVFPREAFGVRVPGNEGLTAAQRSERLRLYHEPYRKAVIDDIETMLEGPGACLHVSIHTFTPVLAGVSRDADIGVLYDPNRTRERELAATLKNALRACDWTVRRNYPYRGTSDGLTTHCRGLFPAGAYLGIEIEVNGRLLPDARAARATGRRLCAVLRDVLESEVARPG